jgi:hypothetical protein
MGHIDPCRAQLTTLSMVDKTYSIEDRERLSAKLAEMVSCSCGHTRSILRRLQAQLIRALLRKHHLVGSSGRRGITRVDGGCRRMGLLDDLSSAERSGWIREVRQGVNRKLAPQ